MKCFGLLLAAVAAKIHSETPIIIGSATQNIGNAFAVTATSPKSKVCPVANQLCITASYDSTETCFNVHSAYDGWTAIGFSSSGMRNAEIYAGWKNTTGGYTVASLQSGNNKIQPGKQSQQVAKAVPLFDLPIPSFAKFSFAFCKPAGSGISISPNQGYIYATCTAAPTGSINTADANFDYHDGPRNSFQYDFTNTNGGSTDPGASVGGPILNPNQSFTIKSVYLLHGALMWIAWIVSPFIGIFIARYMKSKLGHNWYRLHVFFMGFCTILFTLGGFVLIFLYQQPPHFQGSTHVILGLAVTIVSVLQGILGFISNYTFDPERTSVPWVDIAHWWVGRFLFVAAIVNVYLGVLIYENNGFEVVLAAKIGHFVILAIGVLVMAWGQFKYGADIHVKNE